MYCINTALGDVFLKRISALLLVFVLLFSACSLGETEKSDKLILTATIFPQYDFLREITKGTDAELNMMIPPGKEVHGFETTLQDVYLVNNSDLFVYVGSEDDTWVEEIPVENEKRIALTDVVDGEGDDHVWTSPKNSIAIVKELTKVLCEIDENNSEIYKANSEEYLKKLEKLDSDFSECVKTAKRKTVVFAERFPFASLAKDYGLKYYSAFEGCSTETEAGIKTINSLVEVIKNENIPAFFVIEFSDRVVAQKIQKETNAEILMLHSCHNVTVEEWENSESYISLMKKNLENLKTALN